MLPFLQRPNMQNRNNTVCSKSANENMETSSPTAKQSKAIETTISADPNKRNRTNTMYSKSAKENLKSQHAQQRNATAFVKAGSHHENYQQIPD